jgi:hypothetical protein
MRRVPGGGPAASPAQSRSFVSIDARGFRLHHVHISVPHAVVWRRKSPGVEQQTSASACPRWRWERLSLARQAHMCQASADEQSLYPLQQLSTYDDLKAGGTCVCKLNTGAMLNMISELNPVACHCISTSTSDGPACRSSAGRRAVDRQRFAVGRYQLTARALCHGNPPVTASRRRRGQVPFLDPRQRRRRQRRGVSIRGIGPRRA